MDQLPPPAAGQVRIRVRLPPETRMTPGELVLAAGVPIERIGPIHIARHDATIDVAAESGRVARAQLDRIGQTALVDWNWRWVRIGLGRNHGLSMGRLRKLLLDADALPAGRIHLNNTHTLVGVQDFRLPAVLAAMAAMRVNGLAVPAEALPPGKGPGSPAFGPESH
ncbi:hypothetical protein LBMAG53_29850 [Planctomycetota bacterium]|nr:hypothetical protein LBMAG53_29850 [Planctomycetota bacterium]